VGVADFGLFNVVGGVVAMLGFLNSSMAVATQRFMSYAQGEGDLEKVKRIFNMSTILHAGILTVEINNTISHII
jgi:O-antigen/teichoic acid export membrane protein